MKIVISGDVADWNINSFDISNIPKKYLEIIKSADLFICNLEGPISVPENLFVIRKNKFMNFFWNKILDLFHKRQPRVYSSNKILNLLKLNKNTLVTLANNHIKDCGIKGLKETLNLLNKNSIKHIGAELNFNKANKEILLNKKLVILNYNRVGLRKFNIFANIYGANKSGFGASYSSYKSIKKKINKIRLNNPDYFILLIIHDGAEMPESIKDSKLDIKKIESLGADVNIIHHLHKHLDYYSERTFILGDFTFYRPNKLSEKRIGNLLEINITQDGSFNYQLNKFNFKNGYPND